MFSSFSVEENSHRVYRINLCKDNLRILTRILSVHCKLNGHLSKLAIAKEPECRFCGE